MSATKHPEFFAALMRPFPPASVKRRLGPEGQCLDYITARTVMNRLDEVVGPENWRSGLTILPHGGVKCVLTICLPDGQSLCREDIGVCMGKGFTDAENDQGAASDALKRAAVQFGIGRYLYKDGLPDLGVEIAGYSPGWIESDHQGSGTDHGRSSAPHGDRRDGAPRIGRALFSWVKKTEEKRNIALLDYLQNWGLSQGFARRMVDWTDEQVAAAYAEADRRLGTLPGGVVERPEQHDGRVSEDQAAEPGPCKIKQGDPNTKLKLEILQVAAQGVRPKLGDNPRRDVLTEAVTAHINATAKFSSNIELPNLRECNDVYLMTNVLESLKNQRDELDTPF